MFRPLFALALTACGRFGFDATPSSSGDAPLSVDAPRAACPGMTDVHDEDGDLVGDPCDVCPHVADASQLDTDNDGVGDACDPEPDRPRQRIAFFQPFNTVLPEWNSDDPIVDGRLVIDVTSADAVATLDIPTNTSVLQLAGTITAVGDPTFPRQLFIGTSPMTDELHYVELIEEPAGRRRSLMYALDEEFTEHEGVREAVPIEPGPFLLSLAIGADRIDAIVETAGATPATLAATGTGTVAGMRGVLYVAALTVAIDYVIQIETLP